MPQPPFGHFDFVVGDTQIRFDALIFVSDVFNLGLRFADLTCQGYGVVPQLAVGCRQLGLFQFKQPLAASLARRSSDNLLARLIPYGSGSGDSQTRLA